MITPQDLRPGDLMFGPIGGLVPGVLPVAVGQLLLAPRKDRLTWRRWWRVRHVGVVVQAATVGDLLPGQTGAPRLVQAMPGGAEEIDMSQAKHWTAQHVYVRPAYPKRSFDNNEQGIGVAYHARRYVGTPYGFVTYAALAARWLIPGRNGPLEARIAGRVLSRKEMICSQLADQALADAGFHVFDDGRLPQDVVPAELFRALMMMPGTQYVLAGRSPEWTGSHSWQRGESW